MVATGNIAIDAAEVLFYVGRDFFLYVVFMLFYV